MNTKSKKVLVTGGARSGKSAYALKLASSLKPRAFIATAEAGDEHMKERIAAHRRGRGRGYQTIEAPVKVAEALAAEAGKSAVVIIDCITIWLSNLIMRGESDESVLDKVEELASAVKSFPGAVIIVTNEVGEGIVPDNELARRFRDLAGTANQKLARTCDEAYLMSCGIPLMLKGSSSHAKG